MSLLPTAQAPQIALSGAARGSECDALLIIVPPDAGPDAFTHLPEKERWRELNERSKPRSGTVRTTTLASRRQTLAVLGYMRPDASNFERLSLAGRMLKETASRGAQTVGLAAHGEGKASSRECLDALLAAALAQAFA